MKNYVCYHLHTDRSINDSCTGYEDYCIKAEELGQKALCFTEHGNIYNHIEKRLCCEKHGLKYLHGVECYLTESLDEKVRDNYHTILIAKNQEGYKEINSLIDLSTTESHFYYKPRLSFDEFLNTSDNIIRISACLMSPLNKLRDHSRLEELCLKYDYFEVQPHVNSEDQKEYNLYLVCLAKKYGKRLIAGTDTHSVNAYKAECRKMRMIAKDIIFTGEDDFDLTYKSYDELVDMFKKQGVLTDEQIDEAIESTNILADSVIPFDLDLSFKYPILYDDEEKVLKDVIEKKYRDKIDRGVIQDDPRYRQNIEEELRVFKKIGMIGFMLFMSELITWCWDNGIPVGYSRGSVGGSTVAFITDIIDVDPVRWNTIFSRFANSDRIELGDIDVDISPSQRQLVYDHIIEKFGSDKTAFIFSAGTVSAKGVIDEIGRALSRQWKKNNGSSSQNPYSIEVINRIKDEYDIDCESAKSNHPDVFYYFEGMIDTVVSQSMHPAGIVVSPVTLPDNYGTFHADGKRILSINMDEVHHVSLVKYDILGLKNVEIIKNTCEFVGIPYPKSYSFDWNDKDVFKSMLDSPVALFQFEGDFAFKSLKRMAPQSIDDISLTTAAIRPSGESYRDKLLNRIHNENPSPLIDDVLKDSFGFLVYQEQIIRFLKDVCGLSGSYADTIRRAISKKNLNLIQKAMPEILDGYCSKSDKPRDVAEQEAREFLKVIEDASAYSFGYNHSLGYSLITYTCAYLRHHYPTEFIAACLNNAKNNNDITDGESFAAQAGVKILPVKFGHSGSKFVPVASEKLIYKGLSSIKYVGSDIGDALYAMKENIPSTFLEFLKMSPCDSRQHRILAKLDFFSMYGKRSKILKQIELCESLYNKKNGVVVPKKSFKKDGLAYPFSVFEKHSKQTEKQFFVEDMDAVFRIFLLNIQIRTFAYQRFLPRKASIWATLNIQIQNLNLITMFKVWTRDILQSSRCMISQTEKLPFRK